MCRGSQRFSFNVNRDKTLGTRGNKDYGPPLMDSARGKFAITKMYKQRNIIGGFGEQAYWSSTEYDGFNAYRNLFR